MDVQWSYDVAFDNVALVICTPRFIRGDANVDGLVDIADVVLSLDHLVNGASVECDLALDANDDNAKDIADPIFTLNYLFQSGSPPPAPYPNCGADPTVCELSCGSFDVCP